MTEHLLRRDVVETSQTVWDRGWVANHDGNVSAKAAPGRIVATATGVSKRKIDTDKLIIVDEAGRVVRGRHRPFSELGLHLKVYRNRPDVRAVLHAHPPHSTARACAGLDLRTFTPEAVVSIGSVVPLVPFAAPGKQAEQHLESYLDEYDVVLLENHGVLSWGADLEQAFLRMELVESLCRIAESAAVMGGVRELPTDVLEAMLDKRKRAGLGREGRRLRRLA